MGELRAHGARVQASRHHQHAVAGNRGRDAGDGLLEHAARADDGEQLLRYADAAAGPESRPGTARHDDGVAERVSHELQAT